MVNYYKVLELNENASSEAIKRAYRTLSKKYHPDINPSRQAVAKMQEVNEAYSVLSDAAKKRAYDLKLSRLNAAVRYQPPKQQSAANYTRKSQNSYSQGYHHTKEQTGQRAYQSYQPRHQQRADGCAGAGASGNFAASSNNFNKQKPYSSSQNTSRQSFSQGSPPYAAKASDSPSYGVAQSSVYKNKREGSYFNPLLVVFIMAILALVVTGICSTILSLDNSVDSINKSSRISSGLSQAKNDDEASEETVPETYFYVAKGNNGTV